MSQCAIAIITAMLHFWEEQVTEVENARIRLRRLHKSFADTWLVCDCNNKLGRKKTTVLPV